MFEQVRTHRGHVIRRREPGFEFTPMLLGKISAYLVVPPQADPAVFAFMFPFPELDRRPAPLDEGRLADLALSRITAAIDDGAVIPGQQRTYELRGEIWQEVEAPRWWISTARPPAG